MKTTLCCLFKKNFCRHFFVFFVGFFLFCLELGFEGRKAPALKTAHFKKKFKVLMNSGKKKQPQSGKRLQISTLQFVFSPR